ncbi:hypothetical protein HYZ70_00695 [Candidatus Curtissbacteria bacterium]|nr:hypothetical protein [Candidatus Curtissbacteria bacterium]
MRKIFLLLALAVFSVRIWQSVGCRSFLPTKFDSQIIKIKVEEQVNVDQNLNRQVSRFFHNKVSAGFFEAAKATSRFADPAFLLDILGPLGLILTLLAAKRLVKKFTRAQGLSFLAVLISILFATATKNSRVSFYIVAGALYSFSLWGTTALKTNKLTIFVFFALALVTLWYFAISWQMKAVCNEIFFN